MKLSEAMHSNRDRSDLNEKGLFESIVCPSNSILRANRGKKQR